MGGRALVLIVEWKLRQSLFVLVDSLSAYTSFARILSRDVYLPVVLITLVAPYENLLVGTSPQQNGLSLVQFPFLGTPRPLQACRIQPFLHRDDEHEHSQRFSPCIEQPLAHRYESILLFLPLTCVLHHLATIHPLIRHIHDLQCSQSAPNPSYYD